MRAVSDAKMKNTFSWNWVTLLSDPHVAKKSILITFLVGVSIAFSADSAIRIVGPKDSSLSQNITSSTQAISTASQPLFLGPTRKSDTLWSIDRKSVV